MLLDSGFYLCDASPVQTPLFNKNILTRFRINSPRRDSLLNLRRTSARKYSQEFHHPTFCLYAMTVLIKKKATDSHAYRQSEKVLYSVTVFYIWVVSEIQFFALGLSK